MFRTLQVLLRYSQTAFILSNHHPSSSHKTCSYIRQASYILARWEKYMVVLLEPVGHFNSALQDANFCQAKSRARRRKSFKKLFESLSFIPNSLHRLNQPRKQKRQRVVLTSGLSIRAVSWTWRRQVVVVNAEYISSIRILTTRYSDITRWIPTRLHKPYHHFGNVWHPRSGTGTLEGLILIQ